jgi:hypothetical protein
MVALIEYTKDQTIEFFDAPRTSEMMPAVVPYLTRHQKQWAEIDPSSLKMITMKRADGLYDCIYDEFIIGRR